MNHPEITLDTSLNTFILYISAWFTEYKTKNWTFCNNFLSLGLIKIPYIRNRNYLEVNAQNMTMTKWCILKLQVEHGKLKRQAKRDNFTPLIILARELNFCYVILSFKNEFCWSISPSLRYPTYKNKITYEFSIGARKLLKFSEESEAVGSRTRLSASFKKITEQRGQSKETIIISIHPDLPHKKKQGKCVSKKAKRSKKR